MKGIGTAPPYGAMALWRYGGKDVVLTMRVPSLLKRAAFYALQFNLLFALLYLISSLFGEVDISFVKWMALCEVVFLVVILPYLMYMEARGPKS